MVDIALFSLEKDLHAHAVAHALRQRPGVNCHLIVTDAMIDSGGLRWTNTRSGRGELRTYDGQWIEIADLDLVWWRRVNQPQLPHPQINDETIRDLVDNEWRAAISGLVQERFQGVWVNPPAADVIAGNKLYQLRAAESVGLRVPDTLVTQDRNAVLDFCARHDGTVIVKKLMGTGHKPLATVEVTADQLSSAQGMVLCPAMYQERIIGSLHIRANVFGNHVHPILIHSNILDWRRDLSLPHSAARLDPDTTDRLMQLVRNLDLRMGIMDLMYDTSGELVWLELNPQGQFLFGEGLSGYDLTNPFADFLVEESRGEPLRESA